MEQTGSAVQQTGRPFLLGQSCLVQVTGHVCNNFVVLHGLDGNCMSANSTALGEYSSRCMSANSTALGENSRRPMRPLAITRLAQPPGHLPSQQQQPQQWPLAIVVVIVVGVVVVVKGPSPVHTSCFFALSNFETVSEHHSTTKDSDSSCP